MRRRGFITGCAAGAAATLDTGWSLAADARARLYQRSRLVDSSGKPLRAGALPVRQNLVFHYPYQGTPAFLINLGRVVPEVADLSTARNDRYRWPGGVGASRSVVAFSAICAHQLAYPTRDISFIAFRDSAAGANRRAQVIHCCAEHSQYDPAQGARVVAGPATQPLTTILLEHDPASDELVAVGTLGGELYDAFFTKYQVRLSMEHGGRARESAGATCVVEPLDRFCRQQMQC